MRRSPILRNVNLRRFVWQSFYVMMPATIQRPVCDHWISGDLTQAKLIAIQHWQHGKINRQLYGSEILDLLRLLLFRSWSPICALCNFRLNPFDGHVLSRCENTFQVFHEFRHVDDNVDCYRNEKVRFWANCWLSKLLCCALIFRFVNVTHILNEHRDDNYDYDKICFQYSETPIVQCLAVFDYSLELKHKYQTIQMFASIIHISEYVRNVIGISA